MARVRGDTRPIRIFTPSYCDADNTNAQNLTVKEIIARLPEDEFHVTMLSEGNPDPRIKSRRNTTLFRWSRHGNALRLLRHCLFPSPDIYFFPRTGPVDRLFFDLKKRIGLKTKTITYFVTGMNEATVTGMLGRLIREGDVVVGNSRHLSQTILEKFGVHAETICDGVDPRYFFQSKGKSAESAPVVLYAGSFQAHKRAELLIHEAARLPNVKFRFAGAGPTEELCRDLARQFRCVNVTFLGHLIPESLGAEMRNADIFCFPSILEGNPQVLLQASACGLPCIAMELYHTDYVVDGKTGFMARTDSELSKSLDLLLADERLRQSFGSAAAQHARQFDWKTIANQWADIFRRAAAKPEMQYQERAS
jgi:glycosyltransferase involved in cell wall biosynthesis